MAVPRTAGWYADWCEPVVCALYQRDKDEIKNRMEEAQGALSSGEMTPEAAMCLSYQLNFLELQCQMVVREPGWTQTRLPAIIDHMSRHSSYQKAEWLRARLYLQVRITVDRVNVRELKVDEFELLLSHIPEWEYTTELWLYISGWGFRHNEIAYVEQAYEFAVLQASGFHVEWTWQRVHLMVKLMRGSATRHDLFWLIDKIDLPEQLKSMEHDIWPRAKDLGLVDATLELRLQERRLELTKVRTEKVASMLKPHMKNQIKMNQA